MGNSGRVDEPAPEVKDARLAGFRSWKVNADGQLTALHRGDTWSPGDNSATCPTHGNRAPVVGCRCGFNAFYRFAEWEKQEGGTASLPPNVVAFTASINGSPVRMVPADGNFDPLQKVCGIASATGRAVLHETGWHASEARVEALIAYGADMPALGGTVSVRPRLEAVAERYGVPVIEPSEAEAFCMVEGLELVEPMVGAESEMPGAEHPLGVYMHQWSFSPQPFNQSIKRAAAQFDAIKRRYQQHAPPLDAGSNLPSGWQRAIEAKKGGKFYDGLDTKKGLDKPNR